MPSSACQPITLRKRCSSGGTSGPSSWNEGQIAERGAWMARRDDREYGEYLREEQRRQPGGPAREVFLDQRGRATGLRWVRHAPWHAGEPSAAWVRRRHRRVALMVHHARTVNAFAYPPTAPRPTAYRRLPHTAYGLRLLHTSAPASRRRLWRRAGASRARGPDRLRRTGTRGDRGSTRSGLRRGRMYRSRFRLRRGRTARAHLPDGIRTRCPRTRTSSAWSPIGHQAAVRTSTR